ncbi:hypothetical protein BC835DRAFT_1406096 [Cytidiella melzeri]|nr:hypothetical protein BC835DRAFT_1406096 [Cytidiella melzeri]
MPRFFTGDELGAIKSVSYSRKESNEGWDAAANTLLEGTSSGSRSRAIQKFAVASNPENGAEKLVKSFLKLAAARADGSASVFHLAADSTLEEKSTWRESRLKENQSYAGLSFGKRGIYSCTSNGALRLTAIGGEDFPETKTAPQLATLPSRLAEWRLASNEQTFAYAGDEVELSVWDTERAFASSAAEDASSDKPLDGSSKKRKRTEQLLPGEIWRAKNVGTVHSTLPAATFTYLQTSASSSQQHLLVGTQFGDVRRYDTRTARRPVSNWKGIGKTGGIGTVKNGLNEHQVFVSDRGSSLYALDLRNGKVSFGYKGFSGAVTSLAVCPSFMASTAEDRYVRLHSTFPPPAQVGQQQEHKGEVLEKTYVKVVPTVVLWDGVDEVAASNAQREAAEDDDDEVWDEMEEAESDEENVKGRKKTRAK